MIRLIIIFFLLFLFLPSAVIANIIKVPENYLTIQAAINTAADGDTVLVADGLYMENPNFKGKKIVLASEFLLNENCLHVQNTIIDGSAPMHPDSGSCVYFVSGEDTNSVICGFTIIGGSGTKVLVDVWAGGGILVANSGAKIINNRIIYNHCTQDINNFHCIGGGIAAGPPGASGYVIIEDNLIEDNTVEGHRSANGGGISMHVSGRIAKNQIAFNSVQANQDEAWGGGLHCVGTNQPIIEVEVNDNNFFGNKSISCQGAGYGGGLCLWTADGLIRKNKIFNNVVSGAQQCYGAGLVVDLGQNLNSIEVSENEFTGNSHQTGLAYGGAITVRNGDPLIQNNLIYLNYADYGGAIYAYLNSEPHVVNNTITKNNAQLSGGAIYNYMAGALVFNSILWDNGFNEISLGNGGEIEVAYSNVMNGWTGEGNMDVDPMLRGNLFHLSDSSQCIGAGMLQYDFSGVLLSAPNCCYLGGSRPCPADSDPDLGACESPNAHSVGVPGVVSGELIRTTALLQNFPNPFNAETNIPFILDKKSRITLNIYDVSGRLIRTLLQKNFPAGNHDVYWNGKNDRGIEQASGTYFYQLKADNEIIRKKMMLLK